MMAPFRIRKVSVVLPVYRTAAYLDELHKRLSETLEKTGYEFELIMVDDGSPDDAWSKIRAIASQDKRVVGIRLSRNYGQHPAIAAGFDHATGDAIVLMDADLQDQPEDLPSLLQELSEDVDVVYTIKKEARESLSVQFTSKVYHYVFSRITRTQVPPSIGTYRVFTRKFLKAILQFPERNILFGPLMFYMGFRYKTVEVKHLERKGSRSGYTLRKRLALAVNSLISYTDLPHRLLLYMGSIILLGCVVYSSAIFLQYYMWGVKLPPGLTLIVLLVTMMLGALMLSLGVIGMYVFRVYQEVLGRPRYLSSEVLNASNRSTDS